jgi:hypothetical protein
LPGFQINFSHFWASFDNLFELLEIEIIFFFFSKLLHDHLLNELSLGYFSDEYSALYELDHAHVGVFLPRVPVDVQLLGRLLLFWRAPLTRLFHSLVIV